MTPTSIDYGLVPSPFTAGRFVGDPAGYAALLDTIESWGGNSWHKMNAATGGAFSDAWLPADLRDPFGSVFAIANSWPSCGVDTKRHQMILWGGGHANTAANEVYAFDFITGKWKCLYLPSLMARGTSDEMLGYSVDGIRSPESSHTYNTNQYLSVLDRLFVKGGAAQPGGDPLRVWSEDSPRAPLRLAGCYTLSLDLCGLGFVGGETGAHGHAGIYAGVNYWGAQAWRLHDWMSLPAYSALEAEWRGRNCAAIATVEGGKDVLYLTTVDAGGGGARRVWHIQFVDGDWRNDVITRVSSGAGDPTQGTGVMGLDESKQVLVMPSFYRHPTTLVAYVHVQFLDLKTTWGAGNSWNVLQMGDLSGGSAVTDLGAALEDYDQNGGGDNFGITFDPNVGAMVFVNGDGTVFYITPPAGNPTPTAGWTVAKPTVTGNSGMVSNAGPLMGKCRWAADLGCTVAIRDSTAGDVWLYKPNEWVRPTGF